MRVAPLSLQTTMFWDLGVVLTRGLWWLFKTPNPPPYPLHSFQYKPASTHFAIYFLLTLTIC